MLVPEFYFRRWGGRSAGSGGKFEVPPSPGRSVMDGVRQQTRTLGRGRKGVWVALRDLDSKLGSPLNLGSLASNCKASDVGSGGQPGSGAWAVR